MNPDPHPWRQPTVAKPAAPDAPVATAQLPLDADLSALLARDDTLLATIQEQCRARGLYIVHNGREIKIAPYVEPGWRVIVENDKDCDRKVAA
jgi:hypothetical protein